MKTRMILVLVMVAIVGAGVNHSQAFQGRPGPPPAMGIDESLASPSGIDSLKGKRFARAGFGPGKCRPGLIRLKKKLGLTDEQTRKMRQLQADYLDKTRKSRMASLTLRDEKRAMLISGKIDMNRLAEIDDRFLKNRAEVMKARLKMRRDRLALLTPEQMDRFGEFVAKKGFRKMFRKRFGRGHHR